MTARSGQPWILAIDTGTSRVVLAAGDRDGRLIDTDAWAAGHRHGETLLAGLERLMARSELDRRDLAGIVAGTGPGAFTGLRVGLATAKALAHAVGVPIVGISTASALLAAAGDRHPPGPDDRCVLLVPAGPNDRVEVRSGSTARLLPAGTEPELGDGSTVIAVDLAGRAPDDASARGVAALDGLGPALLALGAARLAAGDADDLDRLVPEYVTLPRGVAAATGEISWSHDRP